MKSKHAWNSLWICVGIWVIATMYQIVLESPFLLHLQRLEQIEKDHAPLVTKAEELMQEQESLKAEFNQQTSVSSMLAGFGKSFWDGMTFGAFAKEGIFTEYNKFDRWATDVSKRDAIQSTKAQQILSKMKVLQEEYLQIQPVAVSEYNRYRFCEIAKSWAFLIGVASIIVAVVLRFRKKHQTESPA